LNDYNNISIRIAWSDDAALIHEMLKRLAESIGAEQKMHSTVEDIVAALSGETPAIRVLVAEHDNEPLGVAVFFLTFSTWRGSHGVYLQDIYVAEDVREVGLGRRLIEQVVEWAKAQGADHLRLSVDRDNKAARSFYENLGLSYRDDEMIYTIIGDAFNSMSAAG
jgi:GNAT superfamily N-acetyltransferase